MRPRALALSVAVHLSVAAAVLATLHLQRNEPSPQPLPEAQAEMIFVDPGQALPGDPGEATRPLTPEPPLTPETSSREQDTADSSEPAQQPDVQPSATKPIPPPPRRVLPAQDTAPAAPEPIRATRPAEAPEVRLGEGDPGMTDDVRAEDILVGPDPSAPNIPPRYPPDAVRRGQQGVVVLAVSVAPSGAAAAIEVYETSGFVLLDRAARDAVARWRFKPKLESGLPVASHTLIRVRFRLD